MRKLLSYEYNMNTGFVELKYADGCVISIDCTAVEDEFAKNMCQQSELDWLIYNNPLEYAQLILGGDLEKYVEGASEHRLMN